MKEEASGGAASMELTGATEASHVLRVYKQSLGRDPFQHEDHARVRLRPQTRTGSLWWTLEFLLHFDHKVVKKVSASLGGTAGKRFITVYVVYKHKYL